MNSSSTVESTESTLPTIELGPSMQHVCCQGPEADPPDLAVLVTRCVMQGVEDLLQKSAVDLVSKHEALAARIEDIMQTATWEMKSHGAAFLQRAGTMSSGRESGSPLRRVTTRSVSSTRDVHADPASGSPTSRSSHSENEPFSTFACSLNSIDASIASGTSLIAGASPGHSLRGLKDAPLFVRHEERTNSATAKFRQKFLNRTNTPRYSIDSRRKSLEKNSPALAATSMEVKRSLTGSWPAATDDPGLTVKGIGHGLGDILLEDFLPSTQKAQKSRVAGNQQKTAANVQSGRRVSSPRLPRRPWLLQGTAIGNSVPRTSAKSTNSASTLTGVCVDPYSKSESSIGTTDVSADSPIHSEDDDWLDGTSSEFQIACKAGNSHHARLTEHIIADYTCSLEPGSFDDPAMLLLRICGIIPWTNIREYALHMERPCWKRPAVWYQWLMFLAPCLSCVVSLQTILSVKEDDARLLDSGLLSDIAIAFGSLVGLIVAACCRDAFVVNFHLLRSYAQFENFVSRWTGMANRDVLILLLVWGSVVAERVVVLLLNDNRSWSIPQIACFAVSSLILCSLAFCILYFARGMMCAVDSYCLHILSEGGFSQAVPRWNVVQAMLRKTSGTVHEALCVLQATVLLVFLLAGADIYQSMILQRDMSATLSLLVPAFLVMLSVSRIFFKAAEVTDRCMRVPSLINACMFGPDIDAERQYVVDYIRNSDAGFYMFEFRLTSNMTLKFGYLCIVAGFAIMTQLLGG